MYMYMNVYMTVQETLQVGGDMIIQCMYLINLRHNIIYIVRLGNIFENCEHVHVTVCMKLHVNIYIYMFTYSLHLVTCQAVAK